MSLILIKALVLTWTATERLLVSPVPFRVRLFYDTRR